MKSRSLYFYEAAKLLKLTGPLVFAQLSQTAMGFVDTVMAGQLGTVDLTAVAVGSSIFFPIYLFMLGLIGAVTPMVAQAHGRGDGPAVRRSIRQGMVIGLTVGLLLMPTLWLIRPLLVWIGVSPEILPLTTRYLFAISWGLPLGGIFFALRNGGDGLAKPRLSMLAGFVGLAVNIVMNYLLIYGHLGLPAMGSVGCGWATSFSILAMVVCMALFLNLERSRIDGTGKLFELTLAETGFSRSELKAFLLLGMPLGLAMFVETSVFTVIALFLVQLGPQVVAAHQIALNFATQLYMLPYSLGMAMTVRTGFTIGRQRIRRLRRIARTGLFLSLSGSVLTCLVVSVFSYEIAALYTPDASVRALAASLLVFAAFFQIPDAIQTNCDGVLRGCKDTRLPLLLTLTAYWGIGLPVGYGLGLAGFLGAEPGPQGFWIGLICAITMAATLLSYRVRVTLRRLEGEWRVELRADRAVTQS